MATRYVNQGVINPPSTTKQVVKVLVVEINPHLNTISGHPKVGDVLNFAGVERTCYNELVKDFEDSSDGFLEIQLASWEYLDAYPRYTKQIILENGSRSYQLDEQSYLTAHGYYQTGSLDWYEANVLGGLKKYLNYDDGYNYDYSQIIDGLNLVNRRNNGEFDQVWVITIDPLWGYETIMVGRNAYPINSLISISRDCDPFVIACSGFQRRDSAYHGHLHALEWILDRVYGGTKYDFYGENTISISTIEEYKKLNDWEKYVLTNYSNKGTLNGVGNVHFPWNADTNYDYYDCTNKVQTMYANWIDVDLDNMGENIKTVNDSPWMKWDKNVALLSSQTENHDRGRLWPRYWLYLLPRKPGYTKDGYLKNWWKYFHSMNYITSLTTDQSNINIEAGEFLDLSYAARYIFDEVEQGTVVPGNNVKISNTNIVGIVDNRIKALSKGETDIYYYRDGKGIKYHVSVLQLDKVKPVLEIDSHGYTEGSIAKQYVNLSIGNSAKNTAPITVYYSTDGTNYSVSTTPLLTVTQDGDVTHYFYAVSDGGTQSDIVSITTTIQAKDYVMPILEIDSHGYVEGTPTHDEITLTITNVAENYNIVDIYMSTDNGASFQKMDAPIFYVKTPYNYPLKFRGVSDGGTRSDIVSFFANFILRDQVKPVLYLETFDYNGSWSNKDVRIQLKNNANNSEDITYYMADTSAGSGYFRETNPDITVLASGGNKRLIFYALSAGGVRSDNVSINLKFDTSKPIASIICGYDRWSRLNTGAVQYGYYYNTSISFTFNGFDSDSGISVKKYYISHGDSYLTESQLADIKDWVRITDTTRLTIEDNLKKFVLYFWVEDQAGNRTVICTDGIVVDKVAPRIFKVPSAPAGTGAITFNGDVSNITDIKSGEIFYTTQQIIVMDECKLESIRLNGDYINPQIITVSDGSDRRLLTLEGNVNRNYVIEALDVTGNRKVVNIEMRTIDSIINNVESVSDQQILNNMTSRLEKLINDNATTITAEEREAIEGHKETVEQQISDVVKERRYTNRIPDRNIHNAYVELVSNEKFALNVVEGTLASDDENVLVINHPEFNINFTQNNELFESLDATDYDVLLHFENGIFALQQGMLRLDRFAIDEETLYIILETNFNVTFGREDTNYITMPDDMTYERYRSTYDMIIYCETDELEEFIYPIVEVTPYDGNYTPQQFAIINKTDGGRAMRINMPKNTGLRFNCQHCIVTELNSNAEPFTFEDFGWSDVGNIYWLRLFPGENRLHITGAVNVSISYYAPCKKVGGWLI